MFAGAARGAGIGAAVGACGCFAALMAYLIADAASGRSRSIGPWGTLAALLVGAVWFGMISMAFGGGAGAVLGAMVGAFFPVRRARGGSGAGPVRPPAGEGPATPPPPGGQFPLGS